MKNLLLCIAAAAFIAGCAFSQELHPFPKEAAVMIESENCDCEVIEFTGEEAETVFVRGRVEERTEGRVLKKGAAPVPYHFTKGPLYVDEDKALLSRRGSVSKGRDLVTGKTSLSAETPFAFTALRQAAELLNPFDGAAYRLTGTLLVEGGVRVVVERLSVEGPRVVGETVSAYSGSVYGHDYRLRIVRRWKAATEEESAEREFVWHHYPDGAYIVISNDEGIEVKVFEGANPRRTLGLEAFSGYRSIVFVPKGTTEGLKRDVFLFYYASALSRDITADARMLPTCLKSKDEPPDDEEGCPPSIVVK